MFGCGKRMRISSYKQSGEKNPYSTFQHVYIVKPNTYNNLWVQCRYSRVCIRVDRLLLLHNRSDHRTDIGLTDHLRSLGLN